MQPVKLALVDGCACPASIAPYIYLVLREAGQAAQSIYRGDDAAALLHRHGKRTQREIHADPRLRAISNPAGESSHELFGDGNRWTGPRGARLPEWKVGVDSGSNSSADKRAINAAAAKHGWETVHPYSRGVEGHHWGFKKRPRAKTPAKVLKIVRLRAQLVKAARA